MRTLHNICRYLEYCMYLKSICFDHFWCFMQWHFMVDFHALFPDSGQFQLSCVSTVYVHHMCRECTRGQFWSVNGHMLHYFDSTCMGLIGHSHISLRQVPFFSILQHLRHFLCHIKFIKCPVCKRIDIFVNFTLMYNRIFSVFFQVYLILLRHVHDCSTDF